MTTFISIITILLVLKFFYRNALKSFIKGGKQIYENMAKMPKRKWAIDLSKSDSTSITISWKNNISDFSFVYNKEFYFLFFTKNEIDELFEILKKYKKEKYKIKELS